MATKITIQRIPELKWVRAVDSDALIAFSRHDGSLYRVRPVGKDSWLAEVRCANGTGEWGNLQHGVGLTRALDECEMVDDMTNPGEPASGGKDGRKAAMLTPAQVEWLMEFVLRKGEWSDVELAEEVVTILEDLMA